MLPVQVSQHLNLSETAFLKSELFTLFSEMKMPAKKSEQLENELFKTYSAPWRKYHNLSHVHSMLMLLQTSEVQPGNSLVFRAAIWFHDVVYHVFKKNNERKSAEFAIEKLGKYLNPQDAVLLREMIESTKSHRPLSNHNDLLLFLDFDLAVLAAKKDVYKKYADAVWEEYSRLPAFFYRLGRRKVLSHFYERKRIYFTKHFRRLFEKQARQNLRSEIESLKLLS